MTRGIQTMLAMAARKGRLLLVVGLVAGVALPDIALAMKPYLPEMVALLLFLAALRIGPRQALGAARDLPVTLAAAILFQLVLPVTAIAIATQFGVVHTMAVTALVLLLSASPISGSPNLVIMTGNDPAPAMRLLILGTALLPLTVLPVLWLLPELGSAAAVFRASGRLMLVISLAALAGFAIRSILLSTPDDKTIKAMDGLSALAMALVVVGLMSAVGPTLTSDPARLMMWLGFAFAVNFGLQGLSSWVLHKSSLDRYRPSFSIIAGNRNIALFLVALPASVTDPLLLFIGCYQVPMYLTPLLLGWLHSRCASPVSENGDEK